MEEKRTDIYFVSDVHLGLEVGDPAGREAEFVSFLESIPADTTRTLYLLGDIWDFWYEYKYVVPKGYAGVFNALQKLIAAGVEVYFMPGNHDMWCYHYFQSMGIRVIDQPYFFKYGDASFCIGHGDGLGPGMRSYKLMKSVFRNKVAQWLFNLLHPRIAFAIASRWSKNGRLARKEKYVFRNEDEPLYKYALDVLQTQKVDYFIFGHYHVGVDLAMPGGARLLVMDDWIEGPNYLLYSYFNGTSTLTGHSRKIE